MVEGLLTALKLDHLVSLQHLIDHHGLQDGSWHGRKAVEYTETKGAIPGLIVPLRAEVSTSDSPRYPVTEWTGYLDFGGKGPQNIDIASKFISRFLGKSDRKNTQQGIYDHWTCGLFDVGLRFQRGKVTDHYVFENKLHNACIMTIHHGYLPALSAAEESLIATYVPVAKHSDDHKKQQVRLYGRRYVRNKFEVIRERKPCRGGIVPSVGRSNDCLVLDAEVMAFVQMAAFTEFELHRIQPAKGGGGSYLIIKYTGDDLFMKSCEKDLALLESYAVDALDLIADDFSRLFDKPVRIIEGYDC
ncbi:hypothetical protein [Parasulfitobacter algicola]|uniref:Uncharacterized protein n=1 Tax=Parasulfitobacter algicola TaxID=2614809 RepID=A0ABX2IS89_9RHOB|nr:hypothetical protein [Sulfitobacter algicola]NSX53950.1 hypothetical protein [Sulfitobacter algicola]